MKTTSLRRHSALEYSSRQCVPLLQSITAAYEAASNLDPKNKTFAEQVFGGYVREGNLVKQQQVCAHGGIWRRSYPDLQHGSLACSPECFSIFTRSYQTLHRLSQMHRPCRLQ